MAINLNPLNVSGLAALAGNRMGNLGIDTKPELVLKARQQAMDQQQQQYQNMTAAQSRQDGLSQQRKNNEVKERQFNADQVRDKRATRMEQEKMQILKSKFQYELDKETKKEAELQSKDQIAKRAGAAQMYLLSPEIAKDEKLTGEYVTHLVEQGIYTKEEAKKFMEMKPDQRLTLSKAQAAISGQALSLHDALKKKEPSSSSRTTTITSPDGTKVESAKPTGPVQTETQKALIGLDKDLAQMQKIKDDFFDSALTWKGQGQKSISVIAEKAEGLPVVGKALDSLAGGLTGMDKEERGKFIEKTVTFVNNIEQFFNRYRKEITGAAAAIQELKMLKESYINGNMSPSEFKASINMLMERAQEDVARSQGTLKEGIRVGTQAQPKGQEIGGQFYHEEDIIETMAQTGLSREEVLERLEARRQ